MKFHYFLDSSCGYANLLFEYKNISNNFTIEYCLKDDIYELLGGILALTGYKHDTNKICCDAWNIYIDNDEFIWEISVGSEEEKFIFSKIDNRTLNLEIIRYTEETKSIFNDVIDLDKLVDCIIWSCDEMLKKHGIIGYYLNYWKEFPVTYYLMLKDYRENNIKFDTFKETFNNEEEEMNRTNIEDEVHYMFNNNN